MDSPDPAALPPVWLLDVDGVLNANKAGWSAAPFHADVTDRWNMTWKLQWEPRLLSRIRHHHTDGTIEVRWCTTWCPSAHLLEKLWGWPELQRSWDEDLHGYHAVEKKRETARAVVAAGRRLIWTDDDAFPHRGPLADEFTGTGRALLIKPIPKRGLRPEHLDAIEAFAGGESGTAAAGVIFAGKIG